LLSILLPQPPADDVRDLSQTAVAFCSTPVLAVGDGLVVEFANAKFAAVFGLSQNMIVGRPLTVIVQRPLADDGRLPAAEQAALHMYERMGKMAQLGFVGECSYDTNLNNGEKLFQVHVSIFAVKGLGFVLLFEDRRETDEVRELLDSQKRVVEALEAQLMPMEVGDVSGEKVGTVVAVRIVETIRINTEKLGELFSMVEMLARRNPPFAVFKIVFDTVYAVGGLFVVRSEPQVHAEPGLAFARSVAEELQRMQVQFGIAIAIGGKFVVTVAGEKCPMLEVAGPVIGEAADLAIGGPRDAIVVSKAFAEVMRGARGVTFRPGPVVKGAETMLVCPSWI
jgi:hypothetical protein